MITISCTATPWSGGLGRHFGELLDDARRLGTLSRYYSPSPDPDDDERAETITIPAASVVSRFTPLRFCNAWRCSLFDEIFDRSVATRLERAQKHIGFSGQSLKTLSRARQLGCETLELVSPTSHINNVARRHLEAHRRFGIERGWLSEMQRRKTVAEYEHADVIQVASEYSRQSFLAAGIPEQKLRRWHPTVDERFRPAESKQPDDTFRIAYVGGLTVVKGIPVLLEAFEQLREPDIRLTLVGGYGTRGMRKYIEGALRHDCRISVSPGDPLPHLQRADVVVHPSYQDGFGYGPMEALACGVPVIVSEDTGMKEHVQPGKNGWIVPTGSSDAIVDRLTAIMATGRAGRITSPDAPVRLR